MERPFDHAGMSEPTGFEPHQLRRKQGYGISHSYDACGGVNVHITVWFAPDWWTDKEVREAVRYQIEPEHCYHSYDCCGQYYCRGGEVLAIHDGVQDDEGDKARMVVVMTQYVQNV